MLVYVYNKIIKKGILKYKIKWNCNTHQWRSDNVKRNGLIWGREKRPKKGRFQHID